jgi:hypothetical protein
MTFNEKLLVWGAITFLFIAELLHIFGVNHHAILAILFV